MSFSVTVAGATQADRGQDRAGRLRDSGAASRRGCSAFWSLALCSSPALCSQASRGGDLAAAAGSEVVRWPRESLELFGIERVHP